MKQMFATELDNIRFFLLDDYKGISEVAAAIIEVRIESNPFLILGLATGASPEGTYAELVKIAKEEDLDFSDVTTFNLDEYYPIEKDNPQSYHYYMNEHLFKHVNLKQENINIPNGSSKDIESDCEAYEQKIREVGGIDLQVIGIGLNGHIGFSEPSDVFTKSTYVTDLDELTIEANSKYFDSQEKMPKQAITMGVSSVFKAKEILLIVSGEKKAEILYKSLFEDITPQVPASILQLHQNVTIVLDKAAASKIKNYLKEM